MRLDLSHQNVDQKSLPWLVQDLRDTFEAVREA